MGHKTIAVDLDPTNLRWLRRRALATGRKDMSDVLNEIVTQARNGIGDTRKTQSVVGNARISADDPDLSRADIAIRALFNDSQKRFENGQ